MFLNYLTTAIRSMAKQRLFSAINIFGLAIGLAAVILIGLFVRDELSYDNWITDADKIYRLETTQHAPGRPDNNVARSPGPASPVLLENYPGDVESATRIIGETHTIKKDEGTFRSTILLVDAGFFDVLDLPMVAGDRSQFDDDHSSIIISEELAQQYFETGGHPELAVGQIFPLDDGTRPMKVVAVMKNMPANSHLVIKALTLFDEAAYENQPWMTKQWLSPNIFTYVKFKNPAAASRVEQDLPSFLDRNATSADVAQSNRKASENITLNLMSLKDIHLHSAGRYQMKAGGDIMVVYSFSAIAFFILLIASINFINMSTVQASLRAKEIALRKVVGASRKQIVTQFLGETTMTVLFALLIALVMVEVSLPWFNDLTAKILQTNMFADGLVQLSMLALVVVVALGAGAHPAFQLSAYRPANILSGGKSKTPASGRLQFVLVTLQFTISIALIIATAVVYSQIQYVQSADNGVTPDNKLTIFSLNGRDQQTMAGPIREQIEKLPGVKAVSPSGRLLPLPNFWTSTATIPGLEGEKKAILELMPVYFDSLEFYGASRLAGRLFSADFREDLLTGDEGQGLKARSGVINQTAVAHLGFANAKDAVGRTFQFKDFDGGDGFTIITVIGVVKDINLHSARDLINAMVFVVQETSLVALDIELHADAGAETLSAIDRVWSDAIPGKSIRRFFMEDRFNNLYGAEARVGELLASFAIFAVFVSSLGLYGLSAFTARRRTREIGTRKVLGARVIDIVKLLNVQFSKPVLLANLIAWPVAGYLMNDWLLGFAYRIDLHLGYFALAGLVALATAWLTVSGHALRVARANPIEALRYE